MTTAYADESDAQRANAAPGRAFDWVFKEIDLPSDASRSDLRLAWMRVVNSGHEAGVRALDLAWPSMASWPSGESYLRSKGWRPVSDFGGDDEAADVYADEYDGPELMDLLFMRLMHVSGRIYRDPQVRSLIDPASPKCVQAYTGVVINRFGWISKIEDPCGYGPDRLATIEEGLSLLQEPAHSHPACRCTVDPHPV